MKSSVVDGFLNQNDPMESKCLVERSTKVENGGFGNCKV